MCHLKIIQEFILTLTLFVLLGINETLLHTGARQMQLDLV